MISLLPSRRRQAMGTPPEMHACWVILGEGNHPLKLERALIRTRRKRALSHVVSSEVVSDAEEDGVGSAS